jgi:hypothetical protein
MSGHSGANYRIGRFPPSHRHVHAGCGLDVVDDVDTHLFYFIIVRIFQEKSG